MNVLVTGANGFIGRNLCVFLTEAGYDKVSVATRSDSQEVLISKIRDADFIYHLAGVNRPEKVEEFQLGNKILTETIVKTLLHENKKTPIALTSSTQASADNDYGRSKFEAENLVKEYNAQCGADIFIYRLPNVFGKWCKPNYNSAVATFCHNIINDIPITVNDPASKLNLVYIDDVCKSMINLLDPSLIHTQTCEVTPVYHSTVGDVSNLLYQFKNSRDSLVTERVGTGFTRALYSTYVSYLPPEQFAYSVQRHSDERGTFVEMLKTRDSGQFSFFTAAPGITRGGHYHHTKNEKFLVIQGEAKFGFRHLISDEYYQKMVSGSESKIVETAPGWSHDITNVGDEELIVMLWANEIFDRENPDTVYFKV